MAELLEDRSLLATFHWLNGASGNFNVAGNWQENAVPGVSDDAVIGYSGIVVTSNTSISINSIQSAAQVTVSGGTLSVASDSSISKLAINSSAAFQVTAGTVSVSDIELAGTLTGAGAVQISGTGTWTTGTMSGAGTTTLNSGAVMNAVGSSVHFVNQRTLNIGNGATLNWSGTADFGIGNGSTINNQVGGTLNATGSGNFTNYFSGVATLNNAGLFTRSSSTSTISTGSILAFNNTGTVQLSSGTLSLDGGGTSTGEFQITSPAVVRITNNFGNYNLGAGTAFTGSGDLQHTNGTTTVATGANINVANMAFNGGTLTGSGTIHITNRLDWNSGTMSGSGSTIIDGGATLNLLTSSAHLLNQRTLVVSNGASANWSGSGDFGVGNGSIINNQVGGTFNISGVGNFANYFSGVATLNNAGLLTRSGNTGNTSTGSILAFNNNGTVQVTSGTLSLDSGGTSTGEFQITSPGVVRITNNFGNYTLSNGTTFTGTGSLTLTGGTTNVATGANASATIVSMTGGTLSGSGAFNVLQRMDWSNGTLGGSGTTNIATGATLNLSGVSSAHLINQRTLNVSSGGIANWSDGVIGIGNGSNITVQAGGVFNITGTGSFTNYFSGTATFINNGTVAKSVDTGATPFNSPLSFTNNGTLDIQTGTIDLSPGTFTNFSGNTLTGGTYLVRGTLKFTNANVQNLAANLTLDGTSSAVVNQSNANGLTNLSTVASTGGFSIVNGRNFTTISNLANAGQVNVGTGSNLTVIGGQYASTVIDYSSQYSATTWSAAQATGAPNVFTYGDNSNAWAPQLADGGQQYITLGFASATAASGIVIRETLGNGFVTRVDLLDTNNAFHTVWTGTDPSLPGSPVNFTLNFTQTEYLVKGARIYVDTNHATGTWEEIDAVQLLGPSYNQTSGATTLAGGTLTTIGAMLSGGTISGTGVVAGNLDNQGGQVTPGSPLGTLTIQGNFSQGASGSLRVELGGTAPGQYDALSVTGTASLNGTLVVDLANGFTPASGESFSVVSAGTRSGVFATVQTPSLGNRESLATTYGATGVTLTGVVAGVLVSPTSGLTTSESGTTASFSVVLQSQPTFDVTVVLAVGNAGEGSLSSSSLTFTSANWDQPQTVTITGLNDTLLDGDQTYQVITSPAASADPNFNGLDPSDVTITNRDISTRDLQVANLTVSPTNILSGDSITITWNDINSGNVATTGSWTDTVQIKNLTTGQTLTTVSVPHDASVLGDLGAGGSHSRQYILTLPSGSAGVGTIEISVTADGGGNVAEANTNGNAESNNSATMTRTSVLAAPDLQVTTLTLSPTLGLQSGNTLTVSWNDFNSGNTATSGGWFDSILVRNVDTNETLYSNSIFYNTGSIAANGSTARQASIALPDGTRSVGTLEVTVTTDASNHVLESNAGSTAESNNSASSNVSATLANYPDLQPTGITLSPNSGLQSGGTMTITWNDQNIGSLATASSWTDYVTIRNATTGQTLAGLPVLYNANSLGNLTTGASIARQATFTLPDGSAGVGTIEVTIATDYFNAIAEYNAANTAEGNNQTAASAESILAPYPDLQVTDISAPATGLIGQTISVSWTVANHGTGSTTGNWIEAVYLSSDEIVGNDVLIGTYTANSTIAAGQTATRTQSFIVPTSLLGAYSVIVRADNSSNLFELDETNNTLVDDQVVQIQSPDLVVDSVSAPISAQFGQAVNVSWTTRNVGTGATSVTWTDDVWLSTDTTLGGGDILLSAFSSAPDSPLAAGGSYTRTRTVNLPLTANLTNGMYYLLVQGNSQGNVVESDRSNNLSPSSAVALTLPPLPDLVVSNISMPSETYSGQAIVVFWTISNLGSGPATGTWSDRLSLADNAAGNLPSQVADFSFTGTIEAGASIVRQQQITLPFNLSGDRWLVVDTDAFHQVFEHSGENNNTTVSAQPIHVVLSSFPNLRVSSVTPPPIAFSDQEATIQWIVTNTGDAATSSPLWMDSVWLSSDTTLDVTDRFLGQTTNQSYLNPGESYVNQLTVKLPRDAIGTFYILVKADEGKGTGAVLELNHEDDNSTSSSGVNIQLSPPPDLQVTNINSPINTFSGQAISINWQVSIANSVPDTITSWTDSVYLSVDPFLDANDFLLSSETHSQSLFSSNTYTQTSRFATPVNANGDYYLLVKTDSSDRVYEAVFESNNATAVPIHIFLTPPPDLEIESLSAPSTASSGHNLSLTYRVANNGSTTTPNRSWKDSVYLSTDSTLDHDDIYLGDYQRVGALSNNGGYYDPTINLKIPDGLSGNFYVIIAADKDDDVFEIDNQNNIGVSANLVSVTSTPPDLVVSQIESPASVTAATSMLVKWTVTNSGTGDSVVSSWKDRVYVSSNGVVDSADVLLAGIPHVGLLAQGGSYTVSRNVTIPFQFAGNVNLIVVSDVENKVYESDDANNTTVQPIFVNRDEPDLQVTDVSIPVTAVSGSPFILSWTVQNFGVNQTNVNNWYDDVFLSRDGSLDSGVNVLLGRLYHGGVLAPNASYTATGTFTTPIDISGDWHVIVRTDSPDSVNGLIEAEGATFNRVLEGANETNNSFATAATTNFTLKPVPDLIVTQVDAPTTAIASQLVDITWTVQNAGPVAALYGYDSIYLSRDQVFDRTTDIPLGSVYTGGELAPGDSIIKTRTFFVPKGLSGPYYVFVFADAGNGVYERTGEANNTSYDTTATLVTLAPPVDLVVGTVMVPDPGSHPGQQVTLTYTVQNQGTNTLLGSWYDSLYFSADDQWDIGDQLFTRSQQSRYLPPGESYTATVEGAIPGVRPGTYRVIVRTDITNYIVEGNEANNVGASLDSASLDTQELLIGTPATGTLKQSQAVYYKVNVSEGETLRLRLDTVQGGGEPVRMYTAAPGFSPLADSTDNNELYVRYGDLPSRTAFDYSYGDPTGANQEITVPVTKAGTYYVLAYGRQVKGTESFTLNAQLLQFDLTRVNLARVGNTGPVTVLLDGSKFDDATTFEMVDSAGVHYAATKTIAIDSTRVMATFDLAGAAPGFADLRAIKGVQTATLAHGTMIVASGKGNFTFDLEGPAVMRAGSTGVWTVNYSNTGLVDVPIPLLVLSVPGATYLGTVPNQHNFGDQVLILALPQEYLAASLRPGEYGRITFYGNIPEETTATLSKLELNDPELARSALNWDLGAIDAPDGMTPELQQYVAQIRAALGENLADLYASQLAKVAQMAETNPTYRNVMSLDGSWRFNVDVPYSELLPDIDPNLHPLLTYDDVAPLIVRTAAQGGGGGTHVLIIAPQDYSNRDNTRNLLETGPMVDQIKEAFQNGFNVPEGNITFMRDTPGSELDNFSAGDAAKAIHDMPTDGNNIVIYLGHGAKGTGDWLFNHGGTNDNGRLGWDGIKNALNGHSNNTLIISNSCYSGNGINALLGMKNVSVVASSSSGSQTSGFNFIQAFMNALLAGYKPDEAFNIAKKLMDARNKQQAPEKNTPVPLDKFFKDPTGKSEGLDFDAQDWNTTKLSGGDGPVSSVKTRLVASYDPNDIKGPAGYSDDHFVTADQPLDYTIRFENDPVFASGAAQVVHITQKLDSDLDVRSFRLGDFGFGDIFVDVPENQAFYQTRLDLIETLGVYVDVVAGVDVAFGEAFWQFTTIDPATGAPTTNPLQGFLPPNIDKPAGEGFVNYTIKANATATTGTKIDALATIIFDTNPPIETPVYTNTLDTVAPSSSVLALPASTSSGNGTFNVSWSGSDDLNGSAISYYSIFVSDNGGPALPWLQGVAESNAIFEGRAGHTYAFYSVATDNAGNSEGSPAIYDTATTLPSDDVTPPTSIVLPLPSMPESTSFLVQWSGEDNVGGSGVAFFDIYVSIDGQPATLWQNRVNTTAATYAGTAGHAYAFYSVAIDGAGNIEAPPLAPDAQTNLPTAEIHGYKFHDLNSNHVWDSGEPALSGWTIFLDANANGLLDTNETRTTTAADGSYSFSGLAPGSYVVAEVLQSGWVQTYPTGITIEAFHAETANDATENPSHFFPQTSDNQHFAWDDADPSTAGVTEIYYDFRTRSGYDNVITTAEQLQAQLALTAWENASGGRIRFVRNTAADASQIITIGVGNLAALGGTSGLGGILALGGGDYSTQSTRTITSGVVWLDQAENWDVTFANGNPAGTYDFFSVVAHEIGHALGIGHTNDLPGRNMMNGNYDGEKASLTTNDQSLVQAIYANTSSGGGSGGTAQTLAAELPVPHVVSLALGKILTDINFGNHDIVSPAAPTNLVLTPDTGSSSNDRLTNTGNLTLRGDLAETSLKVRLLDVTTNTDLGDAIVSRTTFTIDLNLASGYHQLRVRAEDLAGNVSADGLIDVTIDQNGPSVLSIAAISPSVRTTTVDSIDVTFSEAIDASSFSAADVLLRRDGNTVAIGGPLTFQLVSGNTYRIIGLAAYTGVDGNYSITVSGAGVSDYAGNAGQSAASATWQLDTLAASSQVTALPAFTAPGGFAVSWTGQDAGSGVAYFDVYVSVDGGTYSKWLSQTTQTSATYTGSQLHSYRFYSVATDQVGNVETAPTIPDARTLLFQLNNGTGFEGTAISLGNSVSDPGIVASHTFAWSVTKSGNSFATGTGDSFTFTPNDNASYVVTFSANDLDGSFGSLAATYNVANLPPTASVDRSSVIVNAGQTATNSGTWSDPGVLDNVQLSASIGSVVRNTNGTWSWSLGNAAISQSGTVTITARDKENAVATATFSLTVAPVNNGSVVLNAGVLTITGTESIDMIRVAKNGSKYRVRVEFNAPVESDEDGAQTFTFATSSVTSVRIIANGGNDTINFDNNLGIPTYINGGLGNDTISASSSDDTIIDLDGDNRINAGAGNDAVTVGNGNNLIWTDGGNDTVIAGNGNNEVHAGRGVNVVTLGHGNNKVWTDGGTDTIVLGNGNNEINSGSAADSITVGNGNNRIIASSGNDIITVNGNGNNMITAGSGDDTVIITGNGNNTVDGGAGNDFIAVYGTGNNGIDGGGGADLLLGGRGKDALRGGGGNDVLIGGRGEDSVDGGGGEDLIIAGITDYDTNTAALRSILAAWDTTEQITTRINRLTTGIGASSYIRLNDATVHDDAARDQIFGGGDKNWLFLNTDATLEDIIGDSNTRDVIQDID